MGLRNLYGFFSFFLFICCGLEAAVEMSLREVEVALVAEVLLDVILDEKNGVD